MFEVISTTELTGLSRFLRMVGNTAISNCWKYPRTKYYSLLRYIGEIHTCMRYIVSRIGEMAVSVK